MTREEAKDKKFTHISRMYGFKCYSKFDDEGGVEVEGTHWLNHQMINLFIWIDCTFPINSDFMVEILEEL